MGLLAFEDQVEVQNVLALVAQMDFMVLKVDQSHFLTVHIIFVEIHDRQIPNKALLLRFLWRYYKLQMRQVIGILF